MSARLTNLTVARLPAPSSGRKIVWDSLGPGLGVRFTAQGAKSWIVKYRVGNKQIMETLGSIAKIPNVGSGRPADFDRNR